jgi:drug/metabolite transporter (DMT)-like permease
MNYIPVAFASLLSTIDVLAFGLVKEIVLKGLNPYFIVASMLLYAMQPLILWKSLEYESLTIMNILWNVVSSILVALFGLGFFHEKLSHRELIGCVFGLLSIYLFTFTNETDPIASLFDIPNRLHK